MGQKPPKLGGGSGGATPPGQRITKSPNGHQRYVLSWALIVEVPRLLDGTFDELLLLILNLPIPSIYSRVFDTWFLVQPEIVNL